MAFALTVYYAASGITSITDKNPFGLESAEGLGGATISRWGQRSPQQSGITDLGFRLQAREVTLRIRFYAATDSALDTHRDTLMTMFGAQQPVVLRVTRDDGEIRELTCDVVDEVAIDLVTEDRPGHLHRATVKLRAANPALAGTVTTAQTYATQWWTAGGIIGTAQVREHVESPTQGQAWAWADANTLTGDWAVAVNTEKHTGGSTHYVWDLSQAGRNFYKDNGGGYGYNGAGTTTWPGVTTANYHVTENRAAVSYWKYWNGSAVATHSSFVEDVSLTDDGAWRSEYAGFIGKWTPAISRAMIFSDPTDAQLTALAPFMLGSVDYGVTTINDGDLPVYPRIQLTGPITNPVLTNTATGGTINLTGLTLGSADSAIIDLRGGNKTLTNLNGANLLGSVTVLPISMADFYLAPAPIAYNGYNVIELTAGSVGTAAILNVQYTNLYMSF